MFRKSFVVRFSTFAKETFALRECTDIASTISLSVSDLDYTRHPNKQFLLLDLRILQKSRM